MSINEEKLKAWIEQTDKKLEHLERNQLAIINGDFWDTNTAPKEPLIKDEKIRKAVKVWAEANDVEEASIQSDYCLASEEDEDVTIVFAFPIFKDIDNDDFYDIAELCGEEEE